MLSVGLPHLRLGFKLTQEQFAKLYVKATPIEKDTLMFMLALKYLKLPLMTT